HRTYIEWIAIQADEFHLLYLLRYVVLALLFRVRFLIYPDDRNKTGKPATRQKEPRQKQSRSRPSMQTRKATCSRQSRRPHPEMRICPLPQLGRGWRKH